MTLVWALYGLLFLGGTALAMAGTVSGTSSRLSLPQFFYLIYLLFVLVAMLALKSFVPAALTFVFMSGFAIWAATIPDPTGERDKKALEEDVHNARQGMAEMPENAASPYLLGKVYDKLEEPELAIKYYRRSLELGKDPELKARLEELERGRAVWKDPETPLSSLLRACPFCESVEFRRRFACTRCGRDFYEDRLTWGVVGFNRIWEANGLASITGAGLALLPFLFLCGAPPYGALWAVWSLGLKHWKERPV